MSRLRSWWPVLAIVVVVATLFGTGVFPSPFRTTVSSATRSVEAPGPRSGGIVWGAYSDGADKDPAKFTALEKKVGPLGMASVFRGKGDTWPYPVDRQLGTNRTLLVSWSLEDWGNYRFWSSGKGDSVLADQAARLRGYTGKLAIRPWAEMNADWHDYQPTADGAKKHGGTPAEFKAAWRHVVTYLRNAGVKATWIFNPTTDVYAASTDVRTIYPGDDVVDAVGLDGYNWGTSPGDGTHRWASFTDIFRPQYDRLREAAGSKPVWVCEVGSADPSRPGRSGAKVSGGSKAEWIAALPSQVRTDFPAITHVAFFNADKERDWRLDSSPEAARAAREIISGD